MSFLYTNIGYQNKGLSRVLYRLYYWDWMNCLLRYVEATTLMKTIAVIRAIESLHRQLDVNRVFELYLPL